MKDKNNKLILLTFMVMFLGFVLFLSLKLVSQRQEIRKKAAGTGVVKLTLDPAGVSKNPGDSFEVKIYLEATQEVQIAVAGVDLNFDPQFFSINQNSLSCESFLSSPVVKSVSGNKISLSCYSIEGQTLSPGERQVLGTFTVTVLPDASGQTEISFARTEVPNFESYSEDLADEGTPASYTIINQSLSPTPTPISTPTPTPTPIITLNPNQVQLQFKIKFYGIYEKKPNQKVKVKIGKNNTVFQEYSQLEVTADDEGVYQLVQPLVLPANITPGENYFILIKGEKHLQSKFCLNSGQNRPCRQEKITLSEGINNLDFSNYPLLGGDLPPQDGVVNALDAVNLADCLNKTDNACLTKADLNLDGIVNSLDINIMNNTIYTRWEEE